MKLKTSLYLSAIFPIVFAIVVTLTLHHQFEQSSGSGISNNVFVLTGVLGLAMAGVILHYSRDILLKLEVLSKWLDAIQKGDLNHRDTVSTGDDEISRLSKAISTVMYQLRMSEDEFRSEAKKYRSRATELKKRADASHQGSQHLSSALTRLRESQQQIVHRERLHVLNQVIRGVTHDLNGTLTPILGATELLLSYPETLEDESLTRQNLQTIRAAAQRIRKTARSLSAFCNTKAGVLTCAPVDVGEIVREAIEFTAPRWREEAQARGTAIVMKTSVEEGIKPAAAEADDLRDAIVHLISNSIEAMPDGGTISVAASEVDGRIAIDVRDTGKGMSDEIRQRCLEPFYSDKGGAGTGMGLSIVAGTIQGADGHISIDSKPGDGCKVHMTIPTWTVESEMQHTVQLEFSEKLRLLIVDDEFWSREALSKAFALDGHTCETAASGSEGLSKFRSQTFDAVFVDRAMPEMGGDELARHIKEGSVGVPVIMLTGFGDIMLAEGDVPEYVDTVVPKPASRNELYAALGKVLASGASA